MFNDDGDNNDPDIIRAKAFPAPEKAGDVLRMADFDPIRPAQIVLELRAYWESLRKGRAIPDRADVEPKGIRSALDFAFILERVAPGAARFRLAGRHLIDLMGMEVRGMPFCSLLNPESRGRLSDVLESVFKAPQIAELRLHSPASYGRPELGARMLILPLKSDLGDVTRAMGCIISEGEIGRAPRRFDLTGEALSPVIQGALILEPSPSAAGFTEPAAPWRAASPAASVAGAASASGAQHEGMAPKSDPASEASPLERRSRFRVVVDNS